MTEAAVPAISAVIPTILRPSLRSAIASARQQTNASVEIVVVVDRAEVECSSDELAYAQGADQVLFTGGRRRGGYARNMGVSASTAPYVAFLDDDDEWLPEKTRLQVALFSERLPGMRDLVVGSRAIERHAVSRALSSPVPRTVIGNEQIEDYLFRKRTPSTGRSSFFTSSILVQRELALAVRWDESLARHQDWDWLMRVQRHRNVEFVHVAEVAMIYAIGSLHSISATSNWNRSLDWAADWKDTWARQTYTDFVTGQSLRYAVQGRSFQGVRKCSREILRSGAIPSAGPMLLALAGILPRNVLERMITRKRATPND